MSMFNMIPGMISESGQGDPRLCGGIDIDLKGNGAKYRHPTSSTISWRLMPDLYYGLDAVELRSFNWYRNLK